MQLCLYCAGLFNLKEINDSWKSKYFFIFNSLNYEINFYFLYFEGFSPQSCLYFLGFWGSKLLKGCFVVSPSNLCLWGMQQLSGFKWYFLWEILKFSQQCFSDSWILVYCRFNNYFTFISMEKLHFSLIYSFYCC